MPQTPFNSLETVIDQVTTTAPWLTAENLMIESISPDGDVLFRVWTKPPWAQYVVVRASNDMDAFGEVRDALGDVAFALLAGEAAQRREAWLREALPAGVVMSPCLGFEVYGIDVVHYTRASDVDELSSLLVFGRDPHGLFEGAA